MKIAIVSGEQSGDELGAALMQAIQILKPEVQFIGVGGSKMQALGLCSFFDQERLAVMGFLEPLKRLPDLLTAKKCVIENCLQEKPDLYLGIDSPDFNLRIEKALKAQGIKTVHYVSPSVWAWRQGRVKTIRQAVDLMLTLFPFEKTFYDTQNIPAVCVGHPLADKMPLDDIDDTQKQHLKNELGLKAEQLDQPIITIMPGSRAGEVRMMGELFLKTAEHCLDKNPSLCFLIPAANAMRFNELKAMLEKENEYLRKSVHLFQGESHKAMQAADVVLLASGTSSLEAMLLKRPMVVAYRLATFTYAIVKHMVKTPYIALPNLIANKLLVPEFIQHEAEPAALAESLLSRLEPSVTHELKSEFRELHQSLRLNASEQAAQALVELIEHE